MTLLNIIHTSDIHIGMKFSNYQEKSHFLYESRFHTLTKIVEKSNELNANLLVISGDLFDKVNPLRSEIEKVYNILKDFSGNYLLILPGNHDFYTEDKNNTWSFFESKKSENIHILTQKRTLVLEDLDTTIYPCPCISKHSQKNSLSWIKEIEKPNTKYHIGIAHGSLENFSMDHEKRYYPMTVQELELFEMDVWLLGHTHISYPENPEIPSKIFFPSTPEPDGFDCRHEGKINWLEFKENKKIDLKHISIGNYRFLDYSQNPISIRSYLDLSESMDFLQSYNPTKTLLRLCLKGYVNSVDNNKIHEYLKQLQEKLFYFEWDVDELHQEVTMEFIDEQFAKDSFPSILLKELFQSEHDSEYIQQAYELLLEASH